MALSFAKECRASGVRMLLYISASDAAPSPPGPSPRVQRGRQRDFNSSGDSAYAVWYHLPGVGAAPNHREAIMPTKTELIWDGKYDAKGNRVAPLRVALPFQTIETVNESAQESSRNLFQLAEHQQA